MYRQDYIRAGSDHLKVEEENKKSKRRRVGKISTKEGQALEMEEHILTVRVEYVGK